MSGRKRIEDMSPAERREVGEKLYANTRGSYTVAGNLIAVAHGAAVSLGAFEGGTFVFTNEGKRVAIYKGLLPNETDEDAEPEPRLTKGTRAQIEERQTIYGEPEDWADIAEDPTALPSDIPTRDPGPHPPQPIAGMPAAISHRAGTPDGIPPIPQGEPVMGEDGNFYMPRRDRTDLDLVGKDGRFERVESFADNTDPPLGEGGAEGGVPEGPAVEEPSLITAATLPSLDFLQPGSDKDKPEERISRPIGISFPSPGGGSPEYPIQPGPFGTQPPPPPDPNLPAIEPQFQTRGNEVVREAERVDRARDKRSDTYTDPDDREKLEGEREAAEGKSSEDKFDAAADLAEKEERARQKNVERRTEERKEAEEAAAKAAKSPNQKAADKRQREALERDAALAECDPLAPVVEKKGGKNHKLTIKDEVKAESKVERS